MDDAICQSKYKIKQILNYFLSFKDPLPINID